MNKSYSKIRHIQESNLRLETKIINEQLTPKHSVRDNHPMKNNFYTEMINNIQRDDVVVLTTTPDKLVIDASGNIYTITKTKQKVLQ